MRSVKSIVGAYFEKQISGLFNLIQLDSDQKGEFPDFISKTGSFYAEAKYSHYYNGG
jgi:hypothetical protein